MYAIRSYYAEAQLVAGILVTGEGGFVQIALGEAAGELGHTRDDFRPETVTVEHAIMADARLDIVSLELVREVGTEA